MKITILKRQIKDLIVLFFVLFSSITFGQNREDSDNKNTINLEVQEHEKAIKRKEKLLQSKLFNPQEYIFTNYKNEKIKGIQIFKKNTLLIFRILPNSCSTCVEKELKRIEELVLAKPYLKNKIVILTPFAVHSTFKAFYNEFKPKMIRMYNQPRIDNSWDTDVPVYYVWNKFKTANIYIPRLTNEELNQKYFSKAVSLLETKTEPNSLIIINGKEILKPKSYIREIDPETIETIDGLDVVNSVKRYGEKGKNGVYIITLKTK